MTYNLSACVFIRDTFKGAFCLFEGMATLLPLVTEFIVMDLGSTDGTREVLRDISEHNPRVRVIDGKFPEIDAGAFATLANDLIAECQFNNVLYYQSDEIWHEYLLGMMKERFEQGDFDLSFWRIQYRENFQKVKWFPHLVHRVGHKNGFNFVGDGMNSDRQFDASVCSSFDGGWFPRWGSEYADKSTELPTNEMVLDVSMVGGFLENIPERRSMHAPFWHEQPSIEGVEANQWMKQERENPNWFKKTSPFQIPKIMEWHLGKAVYELRPALLQALKDDTNFILDGVGEWR